MGDKTGRVMSAHFRPKPAPVSATPGAGSSDQHRSASTRIGDGPGKSASRQRVLRRLRAVLPALIWRALPVLLWFNTFVATRAEPSAMTATTATGTASVLSAPILSPSDREFFETKVRPVLANRCYKCHSHEAEKVKGGLLLETRDSVLSGGDSGPVIAPGKPDDSLLIKAIRYDDDDLQMPPRGDKLSDHEIADLTEWVRRGAPDPRVPTALAATQAYGGAGRAHWSFQPVRKPEIPKVSNEAWLQNPIDAFVLAKLDGAGMRPNEPADRRTLIRRVTFDLIGLPPGEHDIEAFVNDPSPDAYAKVVDRLLASPFYGEHWARYWLDVARYSDTKGDPARQEDERYSHAWTYRDWVIGAFNADLPYDQFVFAQLAGDRMEAVIEKKANDELKPLPESRWPMAALGFLTLGNQFDGRRDDMIADQIDVTTKAFLGLTVACARCHDHKFDPIPTKDYYSLYGVFANSQVPAELPTLAREQVNSEAMLDYIAKSSDVKKQIADAKQQLQEMRRSSDKDPMKRRELNRKERELHRQLGDVETDHPGSPPRVNAIFDVPRPRDYPVLVRGEVGHAGVVVPRRFLEILSPDAQHRAEWKKDSGRVELALAIIDPKNPLTARTIVNRIWQEHWGEGFVPTPDDLGNMSAPPHHSELLDYLSASLVEHGWSLKWLQRTIVLSATYQQSAKNNSHYAEQDPDNQLLWRYNLRRLDFEQMHDALLCLTGELDPKMGGKPVVISGEGFARRRAIYTLIDRRNPPELLTQFDFPSPDVESGRRYVTLVPQQALFMMNSPMVIEAARKLVDRPIFAQLPSDADRVAALYLAIYQRMPTQREVDLGLSFVKANPGGTRIALASTAPASGEKPAVTSSAAPARTPKKPARQAGKFSAQIGGVYENRAPLDAWTKLAHALFQSNEAMFFD